MSRDLCKGISFSLKGDIEGPAKATTSDRKRRREARRAVDPFDVNQEVRVFQDLGFDLDGHGVVDDATGESL